MIKLLVQPWLHFLTLGTLAFFWGPTLGGPAAPDRHIHIGHTTVQRLERQASEALRTAPTRRQLQAWIDDEIDHEILVREALAIGVAETDPVVRQRLIQNLAFLSDIQGDDAIDAALSLGMHRTDPVVRRRLAQRMRFLIEERVTQEPSDAELAAIHAEQQEQTSPVRTVEQIFLDPARRADIDATARAWLQRLKTDDTPPIGDPLLVPRTFRDQSEATLARTFGPSFAAAAFSAPVDGWSGPHASAFGWHLIRARTGASTTNTFTHRRPQLRLEFFARARRQALVDALAQYRQDYDVTIEWGVDNLAVR